MNVSHHSISDLSPLYPPAATASVTTESSVPPKADASVVTSNSNTPEASGTARKAPSDRLFGRSSRNDSSRLASNSGDGPSIHEPGSMTWGGDTVATAPSGRADDSATCSVVTGNPTPTFRKSASVALATLGPSQPVSLAGSGVADFSNSVVAEDGRGAPALTGKPSLGVSSLDLPAASSGVAGLSGCMGCGCKKPADLPFCVICEVSVFAHPLSGSYGCPICGSRSCAWTHGPHGIDKNIATLRVAAAIESFSNSTSLVKA